ncbi:DUF4186 domain-containing protein [Endozoicomonas sp. G2_2]|uniref:DUF4186 domain-containing protein n=1 Tax=Endozoicomonas sp. G2_2 TaxID=2821092 RepID=UPI001ADC258A|nr:DUF4186 domain-containing protein [Endozoicomonas sp. G2_2]MBO9468693.1 DUF4186 domain-containing protein [Endozoicomonas sp. G2_2]
MAPDARARLVRAAAHLIYPCGMRDMTDLFTALARSRFRSRFALGPREAGYLEQRGLDTVREHAEKFVAERLAPAHPRNDGRQTPWRNHPVFIAQHATGTCCRNCLERWHGLAKGRALDDTQQRYIVDVIDHWLRCHADRHR